MTDEIKKEIKIFNCFKTLKLESDEDKEKKETFLDSIELNNEFLLNCYSEQIFFRDILPNIQKSSRGNFFYNKMVKKGFKYKSEFFKILFKAIKSVNEEDKKHYISKVKKFNIYKLPEIELLKIKKDKIERLSQEKIENLKLKKEKLKKYTKLIKERFSSSGILNYDSSVKTPKIISPLSTFNLTSKNNSVNNLFNSKEKNQNTLELNLTNNENSTYYKSDIKFNNLTKYNSLNAIISPRSINYFYDKCMDGIENGNKIASKVFKLNKKINQSIEKKIKNIRNFKGFEKIINEKGKKREKYKELAEKNIKLIKKKMNEKISDDYAYKNRKEFQELLKGNEKTHIYNLYLDEMNKFIEKMSRYRTIERRKIDRINSLCLDEFRKKEYLKNKIDIYNKRHRETKRNNDFVINDDILFLNKINQREQIGTLLPKLLSLKEQCNKELTLGNFRHKK